MQPRGPLWSAVAGQAWDIHTPQKHSALGWKTLLPSLLLANAFLQVGDAASTWWALSHGAVETNPLSRALMDMWGIGGWVWAKMGLAAVFAAHVPMVQQLQARQRAWTGCTLAGFAGFMLGTVVSNAAQTLVAS